MTKGDRFSVDARVIRVFIEPLRFGSLAVCVGEDGDGYEIRWTTLAKQAPELGETVTVEGHSIHAYSGEAGPWAKARVPAPLERERA